MGADQYRSGARDHGDVWLFDKPHKNDLHPTMKPVALVEGAMRNSSQRGGTVIDPFGGSGTTLIAAERAGCRARLIELDPAYCDVIVRRLQDFTGRRAVLEASGQIFEIVAAERDLALSADTLPATQPLSQLGP